MAKKENKGIPDKIDQAFYDWVDNPDISYGNTIWEVIINLAKEITPSIPEVAIFNYMSAKGYIDEISIDHNDSLDENDPDVKVIRVSGNTFKYKVPKERK